ncbi:MAG: hypothetical protein V3S11_06555 [Elusimicrobiota bacterium]
MPTGLTGLTAVIAAQFFYGTHVIAPAVENLIGPNSQLMSAMERRSRPMELLQALDEGRLPRRSAAVPRQFEEIRRLLGSPRRRPRRFSPETEELILQLGEGIPYIERQLDVWRAEALKAMPAQKKVWDQMILDFEYVLDEVQKEVSRR